MQTIMDVRAGDTFTQPGAHKTWICHTSPYLYEGRVTVECAPVCDNGEPGCPAEWLLPPETPVILVRAERLVEVPCLLCRQPQLTEAIIGIDSPGTTRACICPDCNDKTTAAVLAQIEETN